MRHPVLETNMSYDIKLKRQGEDAIIIHASNNGFMVEGNAHLKKPVGTADTLRKLIDVMKKEGFKKVEVKETG